MQHHKCIQKTLILSKLDWFLICTYTNKGKSRVCKQNTLSINLFHMVGILDFFDVSLYFIYTVVILIFLLITHFVDWTFDEKFLCSCWWIYMHRKWILICLLPKYIIPVLGMFLNNNVNNTTCGILLRSLLHFAKNFCRVYENFVSRVAEEADVSFFIIWIFCAILQGRVIVQGSCISIHRLTIDSFWEGRNEVVKHKSHSCKIL